jgi:uncharacterized protein YuzE
LSPEIAPFTKPTPSSNEPIESSEEVSDGVILDYTADGCLVGIEILQISQKIHADALKSINVISPYCVSDLFLKSPHPKPLR